MTNHFITTLLIVLVLCLLQFTDASALETAEKTLDADSMTARLKVPNGFSVELAAGPPLVNYPTMACFDDSGRLFVCESAGLNLSATELEEQRPNSIRMLEDTDSNGQFDRSTVFADKMTFPMGGAWYEGALYVASPPNIWRLEDTDGDRVADKREVLVGQFGFTGNAASIHGCFFGPDGRLYWSDGYHGHEIKDQGGQIKSKRVGSYIFSCKPDGSDVRIYCGGGMDNPVEVDFTDEGEILGTVNIMYSRPRSDCLVHWQYGGAYPHRESVLSELKVTGELLGPINDFGHVAVSGMMQYRSSRKGDPWAGNIFATFFNSGKVVRLELDRHGSTFQATQREFLSSTDRNFRPTDVLEDADGSLLIVDTAAWFYRGCPTSQLSNSNVQGGIYRVRRTRQTAPEDPWGKRIVWNGLTEAQVANRFGDQRFKVRERAIAECVKRGNSMIPTLQETLLNGDSLERRNTVWALSRIVDSNLNSESATALIRQCLSDTNPSVRQIACRSIASHPDVAASVQLMNIVQGDEPPVCREAAKALGRIGDATAVPALLAALGNAADREEEHAIIYALIEINDVQAVAPGLTDDSTAVQHGALIALDQMDNGRLSEQIVSRFLNADDPLSRKAALRIFCAHHDWADAAADLLTQWLSDRKYFEQRGDVARELLARFMTNPKVASLVGRSLAETQSPALRKLILQAMTDCQSLPLHESWTKPLLGELQVEDLSRLELAISAVSSINTNNKFRARLQQIGTDHSRPSLVRIAALEATSAQPNMLDAPLFELLVSLLDESSSPIECARAAQLLGTTELSKKQLLELVPFLQTAGPTLLRDLIKPFRRSDDLEVGQAFLGTLETSVGFNSLTSVELSDVIKRYPEKLLPAGNRLLEQLKAQDEQRLVKLDALIPHLKEGNPSRGEALFFSEKATCATCHRVAGKGKRVGPDLTTIGANRTGRDLLESVVFPSASLVRDYEPYMVLTTEGRALTGLLAHETTDSLTIQQQTGDPVVIARKDIEEISASTVSIMPTGLEKILTEQELADVVAYLLSLTKQPVSHQTSKDN